MIIIIILQKQNHDLNTKKNKKKKFGDACNEF